MIFTYLFPAILVIGVSGFFAGRMKAFRVAAANGEKVPVSLGRKSDFMVRKRTDRPVRVSNAGCKK